MRVYLSAHDLRKVKDYLTDAKADEYRVRTIIYHNKYDPRTLENDIGILTLETTAHVWVGASPICLDSSSSTYVNQKALVTGWGRLTAGGSHSSVLRLWRSCFSPVDSNEPWLGSLRTSVLDEVKFG